MALYGVCECSQLFRSVVKLNLGQLDLIGDSCNGAMSVNV